MGGALFMSILTILFLIMMIWYIYHLVVHGKSKSKEMILAKIDQGRSIGLFALVFGILGQLIGLYGAFTSLAEAGNVSPNIIYAGLKVSMIPTLYGIIIYLFTIVLWFSCRQFIEKKA